MRIDERDLPDAADDTGPIERLLVEDAARVSYIADAGFSDNVLQSLPLRRSRNRTRWIVPAMATAGFAIGAGALSGGADLSSEIIDLLRFDSYSLRALVSVALPLSLFYWLAVEAAIRE